MNVMEKPLANMRTMPIDFARENHSRELRMEMFPLWKEHYKEIALYKDIPLSPSFAVYDNAEKNGMLRIFTARNEGKLVGYEVFFIHPHPHYSLAIEAVQDILFLSHDMRRGSIGYRFLKWCDQQLESSKAQVIFRCISNMNDYSVLLERMGYRQHDVVFSRRISCQQQAQ